MKKIAYQAPVIKTLTMEFLMAAASGVTGTGDVDLSYGGVDEKGELEGDAKAFGNHSVWDD